MKWKNKLINHFIMQLHDDKKWSESIKKINEDPF